MDVNTLSETRLAITLLNADKIPAHIGITISFMPKGCSVSASVSRLSVNGISLVKLFITQEKDLLVIQHKKKGMGEGKRGRRRSNYLN